VGGGGLSFCWLYGGIAAAIARRSTGEIFIYNPECLIGEVFFGNKLEEFIGEISSEYFF
jgi:hypothetical protein